MAKRTVALLTTPIWQAERAKEVGRTMARGSPQVTSSVFFVHDALVLLSLLCVPQLFTRRASPFTWWLRRGTCSSRLAWSDLSTLPGL